MSFVLDALRGDITSLRNEHYAIMQIMSFAIAIPDNVFYLEKTVKSVDNVFCMKFVLTKSQNLQFT